MIKPAIKIRRVPPKIKGNLGGRGKRDLAIITSGTDGFFRSVIPLQYTTS